MAGDEIQQIKDRINIADVVGQYVTLRRAGRTYMGKCPFHKERTPSFHVSPERGTYKCFGCGEGGDVFTFVQKIDGVDFVTVLKQLAERAGVKLPERRVATKAPEVKQKEERLREVCEAATTFFEGELIKRADVHEYLHTRGVSGETIKHWRLGYAPAAWETLSQHLKSAGFSSDDIVEAGFAVKSEKKPGEIFDRFRGRIMFPIFDVAGQPIGVSGRFYEKVGGQKDDGSEPAKYVNSPETPIFKKSRTLYGLNAARGAIRKADCILLVEGQFDMILAHQSGLPFAVALSGTALTPEHLSILGRLSKRLVLALDADQAGIRAGLKSAHMAIADGFDVKVPQLPAGQDPADLAKQNPELLKAAVRTSKTAVEYFMEVLRPAARDERAYKKLVEVQVLPLVAAMPSHIEQEHFVSLVASKLGVSEAAVRAEVARGPVAAPAAEHSPDIHAKEATIDLTPLQKKAGMLLSYFGAESDVGRKVSELLGPQATELQSAIALQEEELRFRFELQVHEETNAEAIGQEMLGDIARQVEKERVKMKFV